MEMVETVKVKQLVIGTKTKEIRADMLRDIRSEFNAHSITITTIIISLLVYSNFLKMSTHKSSLYEDSYYEIRLIRTFIDKHITSACAVIRTRTRSSKILSEMKWKQSNATSRSQYALSFVLVYVWYNLVT
jgi:hypothetical protein